MATRRSQARTTTRTAARSEIGKEIEIACKNVVNQYLQECEDYATAVITKAVSDEQEAFRREEAQREAYLRQNAPSRNDQEDGTSAIVDPALNSMNELIKRAREARDRNGGKVPDVVMPSVENVPKYDAWVPVRTNFWVGKDMELEPYMPYFGDDNEGRCKAFDLYKDMARDANQENNLSDGEVDEVGDIVEPQNEQAWIEYESLRQVRWRAASREAIIFALSAYDDHVDGVFEAIGKALKMYDVRRVRAVAAIAVERYNTRVENDKARSEREALTRETMQCKFAGSDIESVPPQDSLLNMVAQHFCMTCQIFHCRQHAGRDVFPTHVIRDLEVEKRKATLARSNCPPCSTRCFKMLDKPEQAAPLEPYESQPWTAEEIALLREALPVFHHDPCSLAVTVGTRNCREVFAKLEEQDEMVNMKRVIKKSMEKRKINSRLRSQRLTDTVGCGNGYDSDCADVPVFNSDKKKKGASKRKPKAHKQLDTRKQSSESEDFIPCYHAGPCTLDNCTCVQRGLPCESTCVCNNVRYCVGENRRGIARFIDTTAKRKGEFGECSNKDYGCQCQTGHCNTDDCPCWKNNRACNPDVCSCDSVALPSKLPATARRCRNVSVSIARHKRTIVGKSGVHGYGLFAADYFQQGDLIGIYGGQLLDTRLADMVGRLYDAKDHTFFFDITESIVIDGGVLGMKSKFCNHILGDQPGENCHSKLVRNRGDANIALFAKRAIEPGEELRFDYKFQSVVPLWAQKPPSPMIGAKEEPVPVEVSKSKARRKSKTRR